MSTQTITEFLEARIAEDEFDANRELLWGTTQTLTRMNARVLAECAAKRALSSLHSPGDYRGQLTCNECGDWWDGSPVDYPCQTIKIVAAVYADHADYDPEWAL